MRAEPELTCEVLCSLSTPILEAESIGLLKESVQLRFTRPMAHIQTEKHIEPKPQRNT
jgi:hypothetical protein